MFAFLCLALILGSSVDARAQVPIGDDATVDGSSDESPESADESAESSPPLDASGDPDAGAAEPPIGAAAAPETQPTSAIDAVERILASAHRPFEFHGYIRSGFGINHRGGDQEAFRPPTIGPHKWRLGNENETYGEAIVVDNWKNPKGQGAWLKTQLMLAFYSGNNTNDFDLTTMSFREAFVEAGGVIERAPEVSFWAGQRYYQRQDIHVIDLFYLNTSGHGGGVQGIDLGLGKLAAAVIGNSEDALVGGEGRFTRLTLDVRLSEVALLGGRATFWLAAARHSASVAGGADLGIAAGVLHTREVLGGFNKLTLQAGRGPGDNFYVTVGPLDQDTYHLVLTETLMVQPSDRFSMMAALVVDRFDDGFNTFRRTWISAGARPIYHATEHLSLAGEFSVDHVDIANPSDPTADFSGPLFKFTLAPQISAGRGFFSRPLVRLFATAAVWGDELRGQVGEALYSDPARSAGMSFGVQAESWW